MAEAANGPVKETKKAGITRDMESGKLTIEPVRKRRKFIKQRGSNSDYYENVQDKFKEEQMQRVGGTASKSFTDVVAQTSIAQAKKDALEVKPLTVSIIGVYNDPELDMCAMCEYVSKDAPEDDPIIIYVPYSKFTEFTDKDLKTRHFANRRVFIKKRLGSTTDVIVEGFKRDNAGNVVFIGNRNLAMKYNQTFWFEELIDNTSQGYRYEEGINLQARVSSVSRWGLFCEILGTEVYIPVHEISHVPTGTEKYKNGDLVWVKIKRIERDEKNRTANVVVSIKDTRPNPLEKEAKNIKKGMIRCGKVAFKNTDSDKPFVFVDIGRDVRVYCPLTLSVTVGDQVVIRMDEPWRADNGKLMISGKLDHIG